MRLYKVDYSATNTKGYSENYPVPARAIEDALNEYRSADDAGHNPNVGFRGVRYAATRADVVAHSMGGLLTKWYIAETGLGTSRVPRPQFPSPQYDITDQRVPYPDPSGRGGSTSGPTTGARGASGGSSPSARRSRGRR